MSERYADTLRAMSRAVETMGESQKKFHELQSEKLDKLNARVDDLQDRVEEKEARSKSPGKTAIDGNATGREWKAVDRYIRSNDFAELKAMSIGGGAAAGEALVPELIANEVISRAMAISPLASLVLRSNSPSSDYVRILNLRGQSAAWSSESGGRGETSTFKLREVRPTSGELYAVIPISNWLLQDSKFNLAQMVMENATAQFSKSIEHAILYGDGSSKPTGMLHETPTSDPDRSSPERDADAIQCVSGSGDLADRIVDLFFSLRPEHRRRAVFVMSSATLATVRKLRDLEGSGFLWQPSLSESVDSTDGLLLGKRVVTSEELPLVGASPANDSILCGDFAAGYELVEIGQMQIIRDQVTVKGKTLIYLAQRFGGRLVDNDSIKSLRA